MGAGLALIFACGIAWLAWFTRPVPAGLDAALRTGLYPFLPADIVKICLAAGVMPSIWALLGRRSSSGDSRPQTFKHRPSGLSLISCKRFCRWLSLAISSLPRSASSSSRISSRDSGIHPLPHFLADESAERTPSSR